VLTGIRCQNGTLRDMRTLTNSLNASISGRSASGTQTETWNVFHAGTETGVGALTVASAVTATRQ
jgi:hypothetical protein